MNSIKKARENTQTSRWFMTKNIKKTYLYKSEKTSQHFFHPLKTKT
jgi:hypothetical protein